MGKARSALRFLFRLATIWVVDAVSLSLTAWFLPGMGLGGHAGFPAWLVALGAALLLGAVNLAIRPLILLAVMRQGFIILLIAGFFVNAVMLRLTAAAMGEERRERNKINRKKFKKIKSSNLGRK